MTLRSLLAPGASRFSPGGLGVTLALVLTASCGGGSTPGSGGAGGAGGSTATSSSSASGSSSSGTTASGSSSSGSSSSSSGSGGAAGCQPQPEIVACWAGDASMPPGPGTNSPSRCREYTGDDGSHDPHQWDASCAPSATTHPIAACPAGATSRCVVNCGTAQEYVDFNYDGGGSSLICQASGGTWLQP